MNQGSKIKILLIRIGCPCFFKIVQFQFSGHNCILCIVKRDKWFKQKEVLVIITIDYLRSRKFYWWMAIE